MVMLDVDGECVRHQVFTPFGRINDEVGADFRTFYAGHRRDDDSGMFYMQARWYDPGSGRFLSVDPMIRSLANPQSLNAYLYAENNPIALYDPTGESPAPPPPPDPPDPFDGVEVGPGATAPAPSGPPIDGGSSFPGSFEVAGGFSIDVSVNPGIVDFPIPVITVIETVVEQTTQSKDDGDSSDSKESSEPGGGRWAAIAESALRKKGT